MPFEGAFANAKINEAHNIYKSSSESIKKRLP